MSVLILQNVTVIEHDSYLNLAQSSDSMLPTERDLPKEQ
jgi:hypothetical protein